MIPIQNCLIQLSSNIISQIGIVEIKFRLKDQIKAMHRNDQHLVELDNQLKNLQQNQPMAMRERSSSISQVVERPKSQEMLDLEAKISEREKMMLPLYHTIAVHFADLHDTPVRMLEKDTITVSLEYLLNFQLSKIKLKLIFSN